MLKHLITSSSLAILLAAFQAQAQTAATNTPPPPKPAAVEQPAAGTAAPAFTQAELETMVAPVALYPDTLLMQILIAATVPLDVMKADQYLSANDSVDDDTRKGYANAQDWDESVKVLTTAFPNVVEDMADHIDWTETVGNAMLTQSDDLMSAIQTQRKLAIDNGTLVSGPEQKVDVENFVESTPSGSTTAATGSGQRDAVVITPTDPQRVYVPQYNPNTVYSNNLGNVVATTAIAFGTAALIDDIFDDDDDDWDHYWGCHDCGGWNGRPIVRQPDIDVNGNVRIGNRTNIDRDKIAWKPDQSKVQAARTRIDANRVHGGGRVTAIKKNASVQDDLRRRLQENGRRNPGQARSAASSAAARAHLNNHPRIDRPSHFTAADKAKAVNRTKAAHAAHAAHPARPAAAAHRPAAAHKPVAHRAQHPKKPVVHHSAHKKPTAIHRQASGSRTKMASKRGHASRGHHAHRR